jgi:transcriptional regulator with AAA-type ATPase domain
LSLALGQWPAARRELASEWWRRRRQPETAGILRLQAFTLAVSPRPCRLPDIAGEDPRVTELQWAAARAAVVATLLARTELQLHRDVRDSLTGFADAVRRGELPARIGRHDTEVLATRVEARLQFGATEAAGTASAVTVVDRYQRFLEQGAAILAETEPASFARRLLDAAIPMSGAQRGAVYSGRSRETHTTLAARWANGLAWSPTASPPAPSSGRGALGRLSIDLQLPGSQPGRLLLEADHPDWPEGSRGHLTRSLGRIVSAPFAATTGDRIETSSTPRLLGNSPAMAALRRELERVARTDLSVLVRGDTGTGKEVVARLVHRLSSRSTGPFVLVSCAALPSNLAEAELFGHEAGAFTGAVGAKAGLFEQAAGGTLCLDGVEELPLEVQGKLLRVLSTHGFRRLMGATELQADFRVLATCAIDLRTAVEAGRFRADLLYRLQVADLAVPTLRDRVEDLELLATTFLRQATGHDQARITPEAIRVLQALDWPGNVRQLRNEIHNAALHLETRRVLAEQDLRRPAISAGNALNPELRQHERRLIEDALRRNHGHRERTARELGISRRWLQARLRKLELG